MPYGFTEFYLVFLFFMVTCGVYLVLLSFTEYYCLTEFFYRVLFSSVSGRCCRVAVLFFFNEFYLVLPILRFLLAFT